MPLSSLRSLTRLLGLLASQLIGQSNFVNQNDGDLFVTTTFLASEGELDASALQNVLASFGDLRAFSVADSCVGVGVCP